jgi:2-hydroxychromene-2-carboxylate isomerase
MSMKPSVCVSTLLSRRQFLAGSGAAALALLAGGGLAAQGPAFKTRLQRATLIGDPDEKTLRALKAAGFDGVETRAILGEDEARRARELADKIGLRIHSVLVGGATRDATLHAPLIP